MRVPGRRPEIIRHSGLRLEDSDVGLWRKPVDRRESIGNNGAMRYTVLMYYPEGNAETLGEEAIQEGQRAFASYAQALQQAGVLVSAEVLQPSQSTTTLTADGGELQVHEGPHAPSELQLGGTFVIDVADRDAALEWGRQAPSVHWGPIEIRPGATHTVDGEWVPNA